MTIKIRNKKKEKWFNTALTVGIVIMFVGYVPEALFSIPVGWYPIFPALFIFGLYLWAVIPDILAQSEEEAQRIHGLRAQWEKVGGWVAAFMFLSIGGAAISIPLAYFGLWQPVLFFAFLLLAVFISLIVLVTYYGIRKPDIHRQDTKALGPYLLPIIFVVVFSALAHSRIGTESAIFMFLLAVVVVGAFRWWTRRR